MRDFLAVNAKAFVAFFAATLTYIAGQLAIREPINWYLAASYCITAFLVWAKSNQGT